MQDVSGEDWFYHKYMTRVYAADALTGEYPALGVMLPYLNWKEAGEAVDGAKTLAQVHPNILSTGRDVIPRIRPLRLCMNITERDCLAARVIGFISHPDARQQGVALRAGACLSVKLKRPNVCAPAAASVRF
jgi:hypothetical protein